MPLCQMNRNAGCPMQIKASDVQIGDVVEYLGHSVVVDEIRHNGQDLYFTGPCGGRMTVAPNELVTRTRVIRERRLRKP